MQASSAVRSTGFTTVLCFAALQVLDLLTTLVFLSLGVVEANPIVNTLMQHTGTPAIALVIVKCGAMALCGLCWYVQRWKLLRLANRAYACLIFWNLAAILVRLSQRY